MYMECNVVMKVHLSVLSYELMVANGFTLSLPKSCGLSWVMGFETAQQHLLILLIKQMCEVIIKSIHEGSKYSSDNYNDASMLYAIYTRSHSIKYGDGTPGCTCVGCAVNTSSTFWLHRAW